MYVVQYINDRATTRTSFFGADAPAGSEFILPADRCTWRQDSDGDGGYSIRAVSVIVSGNSPATADVRIDSEEGDTVTLGYLGKSGRFVGITTPYRRNA